MDPEVNATHGTITITQDEDEIRAKAISLCDQFFHFPFDRPETIDRIRAGFPPSIELFWPHQWDDNIVVESIKYCIGEPDIDVTEFQTLGLAQPICKRFFTPVSTSLSIYFVFCVRV